METLAVIPSIENKNRIFVENNFMIKVVIIAEGSQMPERT